MKQSPFACILGIVALLVVGCGGSGKNVISQAFTSEGTITSTVAKLDAPITASTSTQTIRINGADTLLPPTGADVPANTPLAVIAAGSSPLGPMNADNGAALTRGPFGGYIWKDGQSKTFVPSLLTTKGLSQPIAFTPGNWHIELEPCYIFKESDPTVRLSVKKILIHFLVDDEGNHSLPSVVGTWPINGTRLVPSNVVIPSVPLVFRYKPCRLTVSTSSTKISLKQTYLNANGVKAFVNLKDSNPNLTVPSSGLDLVEFTSGF